jgi:hypothetical protein
MGSNWQNLVLSRFAEAVKVTVIQRALVADKYFSPPLAGIREEFTRAVQLPPPYSVHTAVTASAVTV